MHIDLGATLAESSDERLGLMLVCLQSPRVRGPRSAMAPIYMYIHILYIDICLYVYVYVYSYVYVYRHNVE